MLFWDEKLQYLLYFYLILSVNYLHSPAMDFQ